METTGLSWRKAAKASVVRVLDHLGYIALPKWRLESYPLAQHLRALFGRYAIDCVVDVGGNEGQYGTFLRQEVGFKGNIVSVEPVATHAERLRAAAAGDGRWRVKQAALGAMPGRLAINVARRGNLSSFLAPDTNGLPQFRDKAETVRTEEVEVATLDDLLTELRAGGIAARRVYLKLDTQGYDLEVLKGAGASLAAVHGLQSEMSVQPLYAGMPGHRQALDYFEGLGFVLSGMFTVGLDERLRIVEYDCVMVRRNDNG